MSGQVVDCSCGKKLRVPTVRGSDVTGGIPESQAGAGIGTDSDSQFGQPAGSTSGQDARGAVPDAGSNPFGDQTSGDSGNVFSNPVEGNPYTATGNTPMAPMPTGPGENVGLAIASMVLGICSIVFTLLCCGGALFAIPSLIMGIIAIKQANRGEAGGKGMAVAGVVMSAIILVLTLIGILAYGAMIIFAIQQGGGPPLP